MKTSPELQKAVAEYRKGSVEAFNAIYEQSYKYLHTCVIHVVKNEDMAMDMLQETYLEISKSISQLKSTEDFLSWAAMIANRKCFAHLKKQKDILLDGSSLGDSDSDSTDGVTDYFENIADNEEFIPETVLQDREKQRLIKEIIDGLNDMQRLCVIGFYYNEQKQEEIAEELGIPVNTVKSHLNRAKAKIKEAVVELDVKKGTRLYSFAPFMLLFYAEEAKACPLTPMSQEIKNSLGLSVNAQVSSQVSDVAKKTLISTAKGRVLLSVATVVVGTVAIIGAKTITGSQNDVIQEEDTFAYEMMEDTVFEEEQSVEIENVKEESITEENSVSPEEGRYVVSEVILEDLVAISGEYDSYGVGNAGLIPVSKKGRWGLVDYDNEVIVPLEYEHACPIVNNDGYSFFEKNGVSHIFDKDGNELFTTERTVKSINDGVVFASDGSDFDTSFAYYNLDGSILYESEEEYVDDKGATGFHEGYAYFTDHEIERMNKSGTTESITELVYPENPPSGKWVVTTNGETRTFEPSWACILSVPIGAFNDGYYLERWHLASSDGVGIYNLRSVDGIINYQWDISTIFNRNDLSFSMSNSRWDFAGFWENGTYCLNYNTIMCAYLKTTNETKYYLVDMSKMRSCSDDEFEPSEGYYSDGVFYEYEYVDYAMWDYDYTILSDEVLLFEADYIGMNNEKYWLVENGEQVGYIDHAGNNMGMFEQATDFYDGKAMIMENGRAYLIDENFNRLKDYGEVWGIENKGEVFQFRTKEGYYIVKP